MIFWHFGTISVNLVLSWLLLRPLKIPKGFQAAFMAGCSYGNIGALAYVMMQVSPINLSKLF